MKGELFVIPGAANKAMIAARRILPMETLAKVHGKMNTEVPPDEVKHERGEKEFAEAGK
jgi:hypothetical protein